MDKKKARARAVSLLAVILADIVADVLAAWARSLLGL